MSFIISEKDMRNRAYRLLKIAIGLNIFSGLGQAIFNGVMSHIFPNKTIYELHAMFMGGLELQDMPIFSVLLSFSIGILIMYFIALLAISVIGIFITK